MNKITKQTKWYAEAPFQEDGVYVADKETSAIIAMVWNGDETMAKFLAMSPEIATLLRSLVDTVRAVDGHNRNEYGLAAAATDKALLAQCDEALRKSGL